MLKIINHYGINHQQRKLQEEVFELQEAIIDYKYVEVYKGSPAEKYHKEHIAEEIADVLNLLEQFRLYYDISLNDVKNIGKSKINRQLERIRKEAMESEE